MFAATDSLGLVAVDALVDADVVIVAASGFDEVVDFDAAGRPLGQRRRSGDCKE